MSTPHDPPGRRLQISVGSGQSDDARLLRPAGGRFARLKALLTSLLVAAGLIGFVAAALVVGSIIALLLLGAAAIAVIVTLVRLAVRRRAP